MVGGGNQPSDFSRLLTTVSLPLSLFPSLSPSVKSFLLVAVFGGTSRNIRMNKKANFAKVYILLFTFFFFKIGVELFYNVVLVSTV